MSIDISEISSKDEDNVLQFNKKKEDPKKKNIFNLSD